MDDASGEINVNSDVAIAAPHFRRSGQLQTIDEYDYRAHDIIGATGSLTSSDWPDRRDRPSQLVGHRHR